MKAGSRLHSAVCDTAIVVVKPAGDLTIQCGGAAMLDEPGGAEDRVAVAAGHDGGTQLGKRYEDVASGLEVLCVKGGVGSLSVAGRAMTVKASKQLPSSD